MVIENQQHGRLQSWSIIIFCFNEKDEIARVVAQAHEVIQTIASQFELIIVDDGSTDGSRQIIEKIASTSQFIRPVFHPANEGIGAALISGYKASKYENICAVPADGQFTLEQLKEFSSIPNNTILSFYRVKNSIYTPFRKFISWGNRQMLGLFFNTRIRDVNWVKVYKRETLKNITFSADSSLVESEIVIKLISSGVQLIEKPTVYLPRRYGKPKGTSPKILTKAIAEIPKLYKIVREYRLSLKTRK